jgi:hypothetical protein
MIGTILWDGSTFSLHKDERNCSQLLLPSLEFEKTSISTKKIPFYDTLWPYTLQMIWMNINNAHYKKMSYVSFKSMIPHVSASCHPLGSYIVLRKLSETIKTSELKRYKKIWSLENYIKVNRKTNICRPVQSKQNDIPPGLWLKKWNWQGVPYK